MINCEIEPDFSWSKECLISKISIIPRIPGNLDANTPVHEVPSMLTTAAIFQINNTTFYVPVVTLSLNDNINFLENIKQWFKRTISWNKYRSEITRQPKNNNLDYLIDPTFRDIIKLSILYSKMITMIPQKNLLINITCH